MFYKKASAISQAVIYSRNIIMAPHWKLLPVFAVYNIRGKDA